MSRGKSGDKGLDVIEILLENLLKLADEPARALFMSGRSSRAVGLGHRHRLFAASALSGHFGPSLLRFLDLGLVSGFFNRSFSSGESLQVQRGVIVSWDPVFGLGVDAAAFDKEMDVLATGLERAIDGLKRSLFGTISDRVAACHLVNVNVWALGIRRVVILSRDGPAEGLVQDRLAFFRLWVIGGYEVQRVMACDGSSSFSHLCLKTELATGK